MDTLRTLALVLGFIAFMEIGIAIVLYCLNMSMPVWMRLPSIRQHFGRFKWYRKWYGGRWEFWYIEMCCADMWLHMPHKRFQYPHHYPHSGRGTPIIEEHPDE